MERKEAFMPSEYYHVFTRGVEKRIVFENTRDYDHFMLLLFLSNNRDKLHLQNLRRRYGGEPLIQILKNEETKPITHIRAYALMPNHFHLLLQEKEEGGISRFMLKLMTAYSMYFNNKYERTGTLFSRPFRSRHVDTDEYFRWVFSYIHANPLELFQHDWNEAGITDRGSARSFMHAYQYSSFEDYFGVERIQSKILHKISRLDLPPTFDDLLSSLAYKGEPLI